jgi:hypothetical protein
METLHGAMKNLMKNIKINKYYGLCEAFLKNSAIAKPPQAREPRSIFNMLHVKRLIKCRRFHKRQKIFPKYYNIILNTPIKPPLLQRCLQPISLDNRHKATYIINP